MPRLFFQWSGLSPAQRFERQYTPEPNSGCWLWLGAVDTHGYSQFQIEGKQTSGHRWSYEQAVGPIPDGLQIDHLCRVRCCVNPDHLEPVTASENIRRRHAATRTNQCRRGHVYTDESSRLDKHGHRVCRICERRRGNAYYRRKTRKAA